VTPGPAAVASGGHAARDGRWLAQALRYVGVSAVALGIDLAVFLALGAAGMGAVPAAVIGYAAGLVAHFALSCRFVFDAEATGKGMSRLFAEYVASGIAGLAVTAATVAAAVDGLGLAPMPGKAIAVGLSFVAVFLIRRSIVFVARAA